MQDINQSTIHVGAIFKRHIVSAKIYKSALSRSIGISDAGLLAYEKRASITSATLVKLCHGLKHNFFADIADELPKSYSSSKVLDDSDKLKIAQLEREISDLKVEKAVLLEVLAVRK